MGEGEIKTVCRICNSANEGALFAVKEMMFGKGEMFNYFQCAACGCLQLAVIPEDMSVYYSDNYYTGSRVPEQYSALKKMIYRLRAKIAGGPLYSLYSAFYKYTIEEYICYTKVNFNSKILDVGCGSGDLLYNFHNYGFKDLTGTDPNLRNTYETEGITLYNKELAGIEGKFDLIIFNHSFEHIADQLKILETAKNKLTEKGVIYIRMPVASYAFEKYKENWVQLDAPRHINIHTEKSMHLLCSQAGLKIDRVVYDSTEFQFMGSEQYEKGITLHSDRSYTVNFENSIFSKDDKKKYSREARRLNKEKKGDQAAFVIRL
jgi:2-polyprenyl-3-methyl-5-hydroxy-6-metoxy-1,4-benzoquinol methylase